MFDTLKTLFAGKEEALPKPAFDGPDSRLAEAALMFHVIVADGVVDESEKARMLSVLKGEYELDDDKLDELFEAARLAESEAVDLYRFTSLLKREFDRDQRIALVERMWEMVFADGHLHELEDNVVWRIAKLLEVETADRIAMKQRVRERRGL